MPGSVWAWPASATMVKAASGQAWWSAQAVADRGDRVVAALDDGAGDTADALHVVENPGVGFEEGLVDEVVGLEASEREREIVAGEFGQQALVGKERDRTPLPHAPRLGAFERDGAVLAGQAAVIGAQHVVALVLGNRRHEPLVEIGE